EKQGLQEFRENAGRLRALAEDYGFHPEGLNALANHVDYIAMNPWRYSEQGERGKALKGLQDVLGPMKAEMKEEAGFRFVNPVRYETHRDLLEEYFALRWIGSKHEIALLDGYKAELEGRWKAMSKGSKMDSAEQFQKDINELKGVRRLILNRQLELLNEYSRRILEIETRVNEARNFYYYVKDDWKRRTEDDERRIFDDAEYFKSLDLKFNPGLVRMLEAWGIKFKEVPEIEIFENDPKKTLESLKKALDRIVHERFGAGYGTRVTKTGEYWAESERKWIGIAADDVRNLLKEPLGTFDTEDLRDLNKIGK
ncbi:MAG: hypothetical protein NT157_05965, partial [Candidatus Micrarchaeota archaeon]|nr:hypothetical protein [Candidatus Micrarchaeota archaeon]